MADTPSTPDMLARSVGDFNNLPEMAVTFQNPPYVEALFATMDVRDHSIWKTFIQSCISEIQAHMLAADTASTTATVQTTDATPTNIATVAIADGECVEIKATFVGIQSGTFSVVAGQYSAVISRSDAGAGMEVLDVFEDTLPKYDSNGLSVADAFVLPDSGNNQAKLEVRGEAATTIDWTVTYGVRRFT